MRIIFATNNKHKLQEVSKILESFNKKIISLKDANIEINPEENGKSFKENANIKALSTLNELIKTNNIQNNDTIIADDTGLCIDFLNGEPGLYSARFMGENTAQEEKNKKIIELMEDVEHEKRGATFYCDICVIKYISKDKILTEFYEGIFEGYIAEKISGVEGFGYDPIFIPKNETKTVAELGEEYKCKNSHRRKAIEKIKW